MKDPPGTIPPDTKPHPRRAPAHTSVSLRHSPPTAPSYQPTIRVEPHPTSPSSPNPPASDKANPPSSVSSKFQSNKNSSGESSDAGKWFETTNNNALQSNTAFPDNEPPFFLRNSSSSETPPEGQGLHERSHGQSSTIPYRPNLGRLPTDGSSTEDFRSVIDDLTVANKKLKQRLKKYEKLYDAHLQDEKLFEVRFHGLPDHKKKDLEETLRKFTAELDDSPSNEYSAIPYQPAPFDFHKTAESGYASMSGSGLNLASVPSNYASNQASTEGSDRHRMTKSQYNRRQQSIHTYLHDIPAGLLPKNQAPMTEKSKKKLVVRRLEQIFAGVRSAPGNHPQPMQQEEVAQSAAMDDRRAQEATGQHYKSEGNREARIMPDRPEDEEVTMQGAAEPRQKLRHLNTNDQGPGGSGSPDQRPTRPLDLDPYRAQVPAENMEYIRHLGFTPPDMFTGQSPEDGHGWLYFNLVVNMAQLHTLNVTPDFVKDAVNEYSSKFELSRDGRRIRWKGGHDLTRASSGDSSSEHLSGNSPFETVAGINGKSPINRLQTGHSGSTESRLDPERARYTAKPQKDKQQNKFAYNPIFFHREDSDEDDDFYGFDVGSSSNSLFHAQQPGDSSGFGSSAMRSSSSRKIREQDGPMIFYKAKFCTDLTGDRRGLSSHNPGGYNSITTQPLGITSASKQSTYRHTSDIGEPRGPLDTMPMDIDSKDGARMSSSEEEFSFSPEALKNDNGTESPESMDFEVSGLGGVQPDDNFAIQVRRSQTQAAPATSSHRRKSHLYPQAIADALKDHSSHEAAASSQTTQRSVIKEEILSASRKSLPSSALPPASFLPFDSTSSGEQDSDLDSDSDVSSNPSTSSSSKARSGPATALRFLNISPVHGQDQASSKGGSSSAGDDSDDGSIDLLSAARKIDPSTIRASEREFDAALVDRLASEIPAGSSAATVGGGSGFNSPESLTGGEESGEPIRRGRDNRNSTTSGSMSSRAKNLKRARTRDPLGTALQGTKSQKIQKLE